MGSVQLNVFAIVVASVVGIGIGIFWFSRAAFGKPWMRLAGVSEQDVQEGATAGMMVGNIIIALVSTILLAVVIDWAGAHSLLKGAWVGLLVSVGFVACSRGSNFMYESRPRMLFLLYSRYDIVRLVIVGAILGVWQ